MLHHKYEKIFLKIILTKIAPSQLKIITISEGKEINKVTARQLYSIWCQILCKPTSERDNIHLLPCKVTKNTYICCIWIIN